MSCYASLAQARAEIRVEADDTSGDGYMRRALEHVSARIDQIVGFSFEPQLETRTYDALGPHIEDLRNLMHLDGPLLALTSLTVDGEVIPDGEVMRLPLRPEYGPSPYGSLGYTQASGRSFARAVTGDWRGAIQVDGLWGYRHPRYTDAWEDSLDALADDLTASDRSLSVDDADGETLDGETGRFSPGQLLRLDDELLRVLAVDSETDTVRVRRGVNGTEAAAHTSGTAIDVWIPDPVVNRAAIRWAALLYARRGAFEEIQIDGVVRVMFPKDAPPETTNALEPYTGLFDEPLLAV
ncbi:MAG TPA: hypothetical protein PKD09_10605 [Aggregatilinea sp.]|uniref:hypothetical protein n=1 Tax=Aggregatilinea sp. TaxID=2806333 RepID=UPI002BD1C6B0|nr:hypothetical protein [Aggregatilinea sp.]HML22093.1 hypothetical protein [Aggregatilinea sp.]